MNKKIQKLENDKKAIENAIKLEKSKEAREQKKWRKVLKVQRYTGEFVGYADSWEEADKLGMLDGAKRMAAAQSMAKGVGVEIRGAHVQSADYEVVEVWRHIAD